VILPKVDGTHSPFAVIKDVYSHVSNPLDIDTATHEETQPRGPTTCETYTQ